jgi:hypothetical protein
LRKLNLQNWAAIAEIVGTVAIIVSLIFVVHGLNQNTKALQAANLNQIYERSDSLNSDLASSPELASLYVKKVFGVEGLTAEEAQFAIVMRRDLNQWEQFWHWHRDGVVGDELWEDWAYYAEYLSNNFRRELWLGIRRYYHPDFALRVDQIYTI